MVGKERHMFPGNNTPEGFFSYYQYILSQQQAEKIYCLKGGPGVGKSTFIRKIGEELMQEGQSVDFLHCSSDPGSLDGIVITEKKVALIDATSPHVVDPIHPGAVDCILHLGEFWNEAGIRVHRNTIFHIQKQTSTHYACAYGYLGAAGKIYHNLETLYELAVQKEELYKWIARIINRELSHKELKAEMGEVKKQFAGAITPKGFVNYLEGLLEGYEKVYVLKTPVGADASKVLELFAESARYRGFDTEQYYCPIRPETKLEHLFVPALKTAFVTSNRFHSVEASELLGTAIYVDLEQMLDGDVLEAHQHTVTDSLERYDELLLKGVTCLKKAKKQHDLLEENYIPNMDFQGVEDLRQKVLAEIRATR